MKSGDKKTENLRVAFLAGTLGQGGAEKQLFYMVRALREVGVSVYVYSLTRGEYFEKKFEEIGCRSRFLGKHSSPPRRLLAILKQSIKDRPHILQSSHFFGNLYVTFTGIALQKLVIGAIRNDTVAELQANKTWGPTLLKCPPFLIANSSVAKQNAEFMRKKPIAILPNVIDLPDFNQHISQPHNCSANHVVVAIVARLENFKKIEDFLIALKISREKNQQITGMIIGDGPERKKLEALAYELQIPPEGVKFLGRRDDVPALLAQADIFVLTSHHEGFPNVILEAMAASLPVVTTPAGEAENIVKSRVTGFVVPHNSPEDMAARILELASSPKMRKEMGSSGRKRVEKHYSFDQLAGKLFTIYREFALTQGNQQLLGLLDG